MWFFPGKQWAYGFDHNGKFYEMFKGCAAGIEVSLEHISPSIGWDMQNSVKNGMFYQLAFRLKNSRVNP